MISIDLSHKTALITGATQGIGETTARTFHRAGAKVILNHPGLAQTSDDVARIVAELNVQRPSSAFALVADVSKVEQVQTMMQQIHAEHGGLDFLINNAAIVRDRSIAKLSMEEWDAVTAVNLDGVFYCAKYALEIMRDGGAIVSFGSISAKLGFFGQANYAASKAGVEALMRVLSRECARRNIRANTVAPGIISTSMSATIPDPHLQEMLKNVPLARMGDVSEVANVVLFLCSPLASYVTGQTIEINGGWRG